MLVPIKSVAVLWLAMGTSLGAAAGRQDSAEVERAFLAAEAQAEDFRAVASHPGLLDRRPVQLKVFRSLASRDPVIFRAAVELCLEAPRLESFAMIRRRLSLAFRSRDGWKREAILQLAGQKPGRLQDLRFVSLLSEALRDPNPALGESALELVRSRPELRDLPAIAESLTQLPGEGPATDLTLPSLQFFRDRVLPLLEKSGADDKSLLRLPQVARHLSPGAGSGTGRTGGDTELLPFGVAGHRSEAAGAEPPVAEAHSGEASRRDSGFGLRPTWRRRSMGSGVLLLPNDPGMDPLRRRLIQSNRTSEISRRRVSVSGRSHCTRMGLW